MRSLLLNCSSRCLPRICFKITPATVRTLILFFVILAGLVTTGTSQQPSITSEKVNITYQECLDRARGAMEAEGIAVARGGGNFYWGGKGTLYATIVCDGMVHPDGKIDFHVWVAACPTDGSVSTPVRDRLVARMLQRAAGAFSGKWSDSVWGVVTLERVGDRVSGRYTNPDGTLDGTVSGGRAMLYWRNGDGRDGEVYFDLKPDGNIEGRWCSGRRCNTAGGSPFTLIKQR